MAAPPHIEPVQEGSPRNGTSAGLMNEIIGPVNALKNLRVVRGIQDKFDWADGNVVLTLTKNQPGPPGETGDGWHFASPPEYSGATAYALKEVVITEEGDLNDGEFAGLWVCITAGTGHTPSWPDNTYWYFIGFTPRLVDVPVVEGETTNCTGWQAWVQMSSPFEK